MAEGHVHEEREASCWVEVASQTLLSGVHGASFVDVALWPKSVEALGACWGEVVLAHEVEGNAAYVVVGVHEGAGAE